MQTGKWRSRMGMLGITIPKPLDDWGEGVLHGLPNSVRRLSWGGNDADDADLAEVVAAWPSLTTNDRFAIMAIVSGARVTGQP
jgi:hypothetical protein